MENYFAADMVFLEKLWVENQLNFALWSAIGLKIKLLSSFFDIVAESLKFSLSENWKSITLLLVGFGG